MKKIIFLILTGIIFTGCTQTETNFLESKDAYFGQTPPGDSAVIFAPGILSLPDRLESKIAFSPVGDELYFQVVEIKDNKASYKIYHTKCVSNKWTEQVEIPFTGSSPFVSADGERMYFSSSGNIYMVNRTLDGWSEPKLLPSPINSTSRETSYSETIDAVAYISSKRPGGFGGIDNWRINRLPDQSFKAENLGSTLNSSSFDTSPCIAPDGSFIIFGSERNDRRGEAHLYISFNQGNDQWTVPVNMNSSGAKINNETAHHNSPSLSPDGKFLFFARHESMFDMDLYWISTNIIDSLREISKVN